MYVILRILILSRNQSCQVTILSKGLNIESILRKLGTLVQDIHNAISHPRYIVPLTKPEHRPHPPSYKDHLRRPRQLCPGNIGSLQNNPEGTTLARTWPIQTKLSQVATGTQYSSSGTSMHCSSTELILK